METESNIQLELYLKRKKIIIITFCGFFFVATLIISSVLLLKSQPRIIQNTLFRNLTDISQEKPVEVGTEKPAEASESSQINPETTSASAQINTDQEPEESSAANLIGINPESYDETAEWQSYEFTQANLTLKYPPTWKRSPGGLFQIFSEKDIFVDASAHRDENNVGLSMIVDFKPLSVSFDQYIKNQDKNSGSTIISKEGIAVGGKPGVKEEREYSLNPYSVFYYYIDTKYSIDFVSNPPSEYIVIITVGPAHSKYESTVQKIIDSIKFTK